MSKSALADLKSVSIAVQKIESKKSRIAAAELISRVQRYLKGLKSEADAFANAPISVNTSPRACLRRSKNKANLDATKV
jgi:hypothetical protein